MCFTEWKVKHETFLTEHDAEMERLRREARANVYFPKKGEQILVWTGYYESEVTCHKFIVFNSLMTTYYLSGNIHKTKQAAEEYGRKYAKAFEIPNE